MIELKGKYNLAKVFTEVLEEQAVSDIINLCNMEFFADEKIRIMPDVHSGKGCVIGTTMTISDKVVPGIVGVDIGCGMLTTKIKEQNIDFEKLDQVIHDQIPAGFNIRNTRYTDKVKLEELKCADKIDLNRAYLSIGTLGGGNHFIEIDKAEDGSLYLVIHTGSRNLGKQVAEHYQKEAYKQMADLTTLRREIIDHCKKNGLENEIEKRLKEIKSKSVPKEMAYVEGKLFEDYLDDMKICQGYAGQNRKAIAEIIINEMKWHIEEQFETIHNYIDLDMMILRKGAVSAQEGEKLLIPINMRDGSLICVGKGNLEWNLSAPHGAGRLMSRSKAKENISVEAFEEAMKGIYTTCVNNSTLDESPMAYKNMNDIVNNITPTVEILDIVKPIYNFKASE